MKMTLDTPIHWGDKTITELTFEELTGKALRSLKIHNLEFGDLLDVAARLTNHPPSFMDKLTGKDATKVVEIVGKLLGNGTST
jgi:hypothetical protein